jgi:membrane-associated phospholipid phosphatase
MAGFMNGDATAPSAPIFEKKALPLFLTRDNKYPIGLLVMAICSVLYSTSNHINIFEPRSLPLSWIDETVPFAPWTVWIYFSEYLFFPVIYVVCKDLVNANKYLYSFAALWIVSVAIFWLWPTVYPRGNFPLPQDLDALTYMTFSTLRVADAPTNCCPSLHVSSVFLSSFIYLDEQKKKFPFFFLWAAAIAFSTLTTKQHYFIDIATGFLMAVIMYWIFHRFVNYRPMRTGSRFLQTS